MKLLMTADTVGGVWTYAMELAAALDEHDVRIVLATMGAEPTDAQRAEARDRPNVSLHGSGYRLEWMNDPWRDVERAARWLLALEEAERPDVVHLNGFVHGALPWRSPVVVVGHSCVRSWWAAARAEPAPATWDEYTRRVRAGLQAADVVAAPTRAMRDALQHHYGPLATIEVIPNGRGGPFRPAAKEPFVMTAGRLWDEGKNVAALARIADELPWPVHVAGSTRSPDGGRSDLGSLHALGELTADEVARWLGRASIYALPARYEPFGLSVLEAALSGCALVLGDIASLRELWDGAAIHVDPDDDEAIASAIQRLCEDAPLRASLASRARSRARELSPDRMAAGYLALYDGVLRPGHSTREVSACAS